MIDPFGVYNAICITILMALTLVVIALLLSGRQASERAERANREPTPGPIIGGAEMSEQDTVRMRVRERC